MLQLNKVTQHILRPHNLIFSGIVWSSVVSKTIKTFHHFPPTNNWRHLILTKICILAAFAIDTFQYSMMYQTHLNLDI